MSTIMVKVAIIVTAIVAFSLTNIASAGCKINIKVVNKENAQVFFSSHSSRVKTKNGTWKKIKGGIVSTMNPGQSRTIIYNATFGCNNKRRYELRFSKGAGQQWVQYYPSPSSFTTKTTVAVNAKQP